MRRDDKILLNLRDNKWWIDYPGYWGCMGGGIELNETPLVAIIREIKEEIDCKVKEVTEMGKIIIKDDPACEGCENVVFLGKIDVNEGSIKLREEKEARYFTYEEFMKLRTPQQLKNFVLDNKDKIFSE